MSENTKSIRDKVSYRDSRRAAARILWPGKKHGLRRFVSFLLVGALVLYVWNALTGSFPPEQRAVLFLFLLAVGLWITEAVPAFAVGLLIMGYLVFVLGTAWISWKRALMLPRTPVIPGEVDSWPGHLGNCSCVALPPASLQSRATR